MYEQMIRWSIYILVGALGSMLNNLIFGVVSERIGNSLRKRLFEKLIYLDCAFYDESRTGDLLSRLNSDTQIVQDGLSTSVAMFLKSATIILAVLVIMFTYSWELTLYALVLLIPNLTVGRAFSSLWLKSNDLLQTAKADLGAVAQESFGNIRTVKAFANENLQTAKYDQEAIYCYHVGIYKANIYGVFYFCMTVF